MEVVSAAKTAVENPTITHRIWLTITCCIPAPKPHTYIYHDEAHKKASALYCRYSQYVDDLARGVLDDVRDAGEGGADHKLVDERGKHLESEELAHCIANKTNRYNRRISMSSGWPERAGVCCFWGEGPDSQHQQSPLQGGETRQRLSS